MRSNVKFAVTSANIAVSLLLFLLTSITFVDVFGRNVLSRPLLGSTEITEYTMVGITFLSYPVLAVLNRNIVVDLFDTLFSARVRKLLHYLGCLLGFILFAILAWRFWIQAGRVVSYGDVTPQLRLPVAPAYYFMSVMSGLTGLAFLIGARMQVDASEAAPL